jgi:hypothetical protein
VGDRREEYSGFMGTPAHRPLIATNNHRVPAQSHGKWSKAAPTAKDVDSVWSEFIQLIPVMDDCRVDANGVPISSEGRAPKREEAEIPAKWSDRHGNAILQVAIRQEVFKDCDGPSSYPTEVWFFLDVHGHAEPMPGQLGSTRNGLVFPLGFVDLTGDGKDEAIFQLAGYDKGGYALYYDDFRKVAVVSWSYH